MTNSNIEEIVKFNIPRLLGPEGESSYHNLIELPPEAVHILLNEYENETNPELRGAIVEVIWQFRDPGLIDILSEALSEEDQSIWEHAIDGLVNIGGERSKHALELSLAKETSKVKKEWITEAIDQINSQFDSHA